MRLIVSNAFSLNMLPGGFDGKISVLTTGAIAAAKLIEVFQKTDDVVNAIGHPSTDTVVRSELEKLGVMLKPGERITVNLTSRDALLVAQYKGERLPEGATTLPDGATIEWMLLKARNSLNNK